MKKVGIVICNYNRKNMVIECIQCVLESKFTDYAVFVVDNASTDGSVDGILKKYPEAVVYPNDSVPETRLTVIQNAENLGGSGGFNTGLRMAFEKGCPYLMCIDNDAFLDENAIGNLYTFLENHPETGIAASKIYHMEEPDLVQNFGQTIDFDNFCTIVPDLNRWEDGTMPAYVYTDSVPACSLMIRREIIEKIGFMPEENFLYWDDIEWCYRCGLLGKKVASVGNSVALHAMGAKKENESTFPTYYAWRNWISFFIRYTPRERWEDMADNFLDALFTLIYQEFYRGTKNRAASVMLAYDDAMHGVTGKAGEDRILPVDGSTEPFEALFSISDRFYLEKNQYPGTAASLQETAKRLGYDIEWLSEPQPGVPTIRICNSIFHIADLSGKYIYVDVNDCVLRTEENLFYVINYACAKNAFIYAHKPVFLEALKRREERRHEIP